MARPVTHRYYTDKEGIVHERQMCSIEGCNRLRNIFKKTREDGSIYYYELTTCCHHRKDGGTFRCDEHDKRREKIWRAQGIYLSYSEYQQLYSLQDGKCNLCGTPESDLKDVLFVDHCHTTGKIRGLVCKRCNAVLVWLEKFTTLDEIKQHLATDVFTKYKGIIVENPKFKKKRKVT